MNNKYLARDAIRKKLIGKKLTYKEIYAIMDEISRDNLGDVLTTYFVASGYSKGFSNEEIYHLTKAMVETGEKLEFKGIVADKHSIGGVPGSRITMIVVPIVAAAGYKIPKSSSRAITTPAGTADSMEVLAKVSFTEKELYQIIEKAGGCMVWGGSFNIAPADDEIIRIEEPLLFESFDKILVSVMAKKIAFGSSHVVIDLPYGKYVKLRTEDDAHVLRRKFEFIAKKFNLKIKVVVRRAKEPAGNGIGPLLEARDALKVLEQTPDRPIALEEEALRFAGTLLEICLKDDTEKKQKEVKEKYKDTHIWAKDLLTSGVAREKMMEIVKAQGGKEVESKDLKPAKNKAIIKSETAGVVKEINSKDVTILAKILGAPQSHESGLFLCKKIDDKVDKNEEVAIMYSHTKAKLKEALDSLDTFPIFEVER